MAAVNLAGRRHGIRPAMRLAEATALTTTEIREHDPHEDIDALCTLAERAQRFSPLVGLEQIDDKLWAGRSLLQPECLLLDVTGIGPVFGGEAALLEQLSQWLGTQNYFGCMAIASSIGAAWALANYGTRHEPARAAPRPVKLSEIVPPCRSLRVDPAGTAAAIGPLPLAALRLDKETIHALHRLGIRQLEQLQQLPREGLASRLGERLLLRWDQAYGHRDEPLVALHSSPDWSLEQTLEYPTQHRDTIIELVRRLSHTLSQRLSNRGEGALRIVCRLDLVESRPLVLQLGLFRPTHDAEHLQLMLVGQLEQQLSALQRAPLWRLSLQATLTAPLRWRQSDLFEAGEAVNRQQLARLIDTLSNRLGRKQVLGAKVQRDAQPENAFTLQPLTGRRSDGTEQATVRKLSSRLARQCAEPSVDDPLRRPTHLFSPPIEIEFHWEGKAAKNGPPSVGLSGSNLPRGSRFLYQGQPYTLLESSGPERLESGWWRGPSVRRDYYRIVTTSGSWWWIFWELTTNRWFLHGGFD